ncbi:TIM44-like domain-containing protein [Thauera sp.]|jgi:predicted lipid-binding transport protein (Tim44 family)|uniref:Tim44 domain-containing protein n=1 Tax=Thauera sp. TaxID=1905334 RepID=UPI00257B6D9B|nr:TIM44-like domain-containing protein [Thauera sp.]
MKNLFLTLIVAVLSFGFGVPEAEAKRLGGGSSFGMQRQATPQQAPRQPAATQTPASAATPAAAPKRSWMGPVAGLAAGLGLAALFSHLGLGEEMASFMMILLLAVAAFFIFRLLFRRGGNTQQGQNLQYAGASAASGAATPLRPAPAAAPMSGAGTSASGLDKAIAEGFDVQGFARQAKLNFIRLQAANDTGNLDDLREFTTPEVFAEVRMQLTERGTAEQRTDVVELNADVVDVEEENGRYVVSVRFNGLLREEEGAAPAHFDEIWHLTKPVSGSGGWLIAGIQQIS